ncbi:MAG: hypothetical protein QXG57_04150, partial [Thermofilaceae archaeon]
SYFSPYPSPYHAFAAFTEAIACLEAELFSRLARREEVARWVKPLPESEAFRFFAREGEPLPYVARSGLDLIEIVKRVPAQSLEFHVENGHLAEWLRSVVGDVIAAEKVEGMRGLRGEELRERLYKALCERLLESFSTAHRGSQCAEGLR